MKIIKNTIDIFIIFSFLGMLIFMLRFMNKENVNFSNLLLVNEILMDLANKTDDYLRKSKNGVKITLEDKYNHIIYVKESLIGCVKILLNKY